MLSWGNARMALQSIRAAKWRSFLTMLGVIVGVLSVVTVVSLGEGVKQQLTSQIKQTGQDLITVRGGQVGTRNAAGVITHINLLNLLAGTNLSDNDYQTIQQVPGLRVIAPFAVVAGVPVTDDGVQDGSVSIVATNERGAEALDQTILSGGFFDANEGSIGQAVIGKQVAADLFHENIPIGRGFTLRGQKLSVVGVFQQFPSSPLNGGVDYNNTIFIPYSYATTLLKAPLQPYQVLVRPVEDASVDATVAAITAALQASHGGQADFSVLKPQDSLAIANTVLNLLTALVAAVAAISLVVGGIGIMNIMLVAVSERTHEIGVRKSVGAFNRQIMGQFLTEAAILSTVGGFIGIILSLIANYLLHIFTDLKPVINLPIMVVTMGAAVLVGCVFGMAPALKAARKDPIEALRRP